MVCHRRIKRPRSFRRAGNLLLGTGRQPRQVGRLRHDQLLAAEPRGVLASGETERGHAPDDPGGRPRADDAGPDLVLGTPAEQFAEPRELLVEAGAHRLDRHVVRGDASPAGRHHHVDVVAVGQAVDSRLEGVDVVGDDLPGGDSVVSSLERRGDGVARGVLIERPGGRNREDRCRQRPDVVVVVVVVVAVVVIVTLTVAMIVASVALFIVTLSRTVIVIRHTMGFSPGG